MFWTVPLSIIRSFSLYTQRWYMSYRFADSLRAGSGRLYRNTRWNRILKQRHQSSWLNVTGNKELGKERAKSKRKFICEHTISDPTDHKNAASAHSPITSLETTKTLLRTESFSRS